MFYVSSYVLFPFVNQISGFVVACFLIFVYIQYVTVGTYL